MNIINSENNKLIDRKFTFSLFRSDTITNSGNNVTINAGDGKDTIINSGQNVTIFGNGGNDSVKNSGANVTINAGNGLDTIQNTYGGDSTSINAGFYNDSVRNYANNVTIEGNEGNDTINNSGGQNIKIDGGTGNDSIYSYGLNATITGGKGNDSIRNEGLKALVQYNDGDGDDLIEGFNETSTLLIDGGSGAYSAHKSGNDIILWVGDGNITLKGAAALPNLNISGIFPVNVTDHYENSRNRLVIVGNDSANTITNNGQKVTIAGNGGNDSIKNIYGGDLTSINAGADNDFIFNQCTSVTIDGGAGDDSIQNDRKTSHSSKIQGGEGNDYFENDGDNVTIDGGSGNDTIKNYAGQSAKIYGGAGADTIYNNASNVTIDAGDGNDTINNYENNVTINASAGDDSIYNSSSNVTINGGEGSDSIRNTDANVNISGGAGNDSIQNAGANVTISGNDGDDTIQNGSANVLITSGADNDSIQNTGANVTISGGKGFDSIRNEGSNVLVQYNDGDGSKLIEGFNATSTLQLGDGKGTYTSEKSDNDIIITVGEGKITLKGAASLSTVNITGMQIISVDKNYFNDKSNVIIIGNDFSNSITNSGSRVSIDVLGGKDSILNTGSEVTIEGGSGSDTIHNSAGGDLTSINAGSGNDSVYNFDRNVTINTGAGNDSITNWGRNVTINAGEGNDSIINHENNVTINASAGDDTIYNNWNFASNRPWPYNEGKNVVFKYALGDGNDVIYGFRADSTLDIGLETFASVKSGNDLIIRIGEEEITLIGAANLSTVNVTGIEDARLNIDNSSNDVSIVGSLYDDIIRNYANNVTMIGNGGNDRITNLNGSNVTMIGNGGNDSIYIMENTSNIMALGSAGDDSIYNRGDSVTLDGGAGADTITNNVGFNVTISGGLGNDYLYNYARYATMDGGLGNDSIYNYGDSVIIDGGLGDDSIYNMRSSEVTINAGAGDDLISLDANSWKDLIKYTSGDGNDIIYGFKTNSTLSIAGGAAFSEKSGSDIILTVGEGKITLSGAANLSKVNIIETPVNINNNNSNATLYGTNADDTIANTGDKVTIRALGGKDSLNNNAANASMDGGADDDLITNTGKRSTLTGQSGNDTIKNDAGKVLAIGGAGNDSIFNHGEGVSISGGSGSNIIENYTNSNEGSIMGGEGNDSLQNRSSKVTISGDAGDDTILSSGTSNSILGGAGNDLISLQSAYKNTILGGAGDDTINLDWSSNNALIKHGKGDGNDVIEGFNATSTLQLGDGGEDSYNKSIEGDDIIITVGEEKITLKGAAKLSELNIDGTTILNVNNTENAVALIGSRLNDSVKNSGNRVTIQTFAGNDIVENSGSRVTIDAGADNDSITNSGNKVLIQYSGGDDLITGFDDMVTLNIAETEFTSATSGNDLIITVGTDKITLEGAASLSNPQIVSSTLTRKNSGDKITFDENATFNHGRIKAEVFGRGTILIKSDNAISFENNSSASVTAPINHQIGVDSSNITINDLPINAKTGAGTVTVERNGMSFSGYGVQFADLEVAKESYFGKLAPMTVAYNSDDEIYTLYNTACVKTLSNDFTKLTFNFSGTNNEKYACYKINGLAILTTKEKNDIIEVNGNTFKIQDKELDAEKIGRVTIDEQITFSGTEINFDGVKTTYAHNKPVIYSSDGKITINDAATIETGDETKTFNCEAGSYTINGKTFETSAALTFTADASEIKIPMSNAATEIYFDGVKISGDSGELVFDLADGKISIPSGANLNITSSREVKLNLAAGNFTIDGKKLSLDSALEISADKDNIKIPLSENPVTINGAAITGTGAATIDNTNELFCTVLLPDGAFVQNTSENIYQLTGKNTSASFGDANKKVLLTSDGTTYIEYEKANTIGVGLNRLMFEQVEISGVDAWTVETSGTSGIDKITGITDGATISTSTEGINAGDFSFEVETDGAGSFNIAGEKITTTGNATYVVRGNSTGEIKVAPKGEEYADDDSEAAGKIYNFDKAGDYTVNGITFHATANSKVQTITRGVEFDLSSGTFQYDGLTLTGSGIAQINRYNSSLISLTNGAKISGDNYYNRQFEISGAVEIIGKKFDTNEQIRCGLINVQDTIEGQSVTLKGFYVDDKYVQIQSDCYDSVKVVDKNISSIEGVKNSAQITGNGLANVSIITTESGTFKIHDNTYKISDDSDGVIFVTDSHGNVAEINGLSGSVEGNFANGIKINGKAIEITGASSIKVTSDGENITEISNVAGDLITTDGKTYRQNVRVYELGGAKKLTTSTDGTIIFSGNKFEMSAGKTFELDEAGNISGIETAQSDSAVSAENVAEDFSTMNLSTTEGLDEVIGDFSEGLTVNGAFVKVTDSANFAVKNDAENVYIETNAPDTFTINGKTFETSADKTIFKLDASGNVSEIVTDKFYLYPDEEAYLIEGDFNNEIIFNGQKFCVTGTNDTTIFISEETLIGVELARNSVEVVESGNASEIALNGGGEITISGKTLSTTDDFIGLLRINSVKDFIGTISGELGGVDLAGITIESDDKFSATGDGKKVIAIENLQNGTLTSDDLDAITINGAKITLDDSEEVTLTITDGELKTSAEEILDLENATVISKNTTLKGGEVVIVEDTSAKLKITASKGQDTIYTSGKNVDIDLKGGATKIYAAGGRVTIENYDAKTGAAFMTESINAIAYDDGKLTVNSARVTFAENADSRIINFVDTAGDLQKIGFASDDSKLDASNETENLILIGASNSTIAGGKGRNQIRLDENSDSTILLNGKNTVENFNAGFDGDKISVDAANYDFNFDGSNISVKSGDARALLQNISSDDDAARILTLINGKEIKTAIAQEGLIISAGNDTADIYVGKKSGVDFTGFDDSLVADLNNNFYGINRVTLGGGQNTLISSSQNETLTSSDGSTEFIFGKDSGRDLIKNFNFDEDKINVGNETITAVNVNNAGGVCMKISGSATLTLEDAQGKNFQINNFVALVDKNLTYNNTANYFVATSQNASVIINESAEIWLDGSHGKYFSGDIRTLDASTADGKTELAGNDLDNTILAGNGDSSLWGGNGGNDFMQGGAGKNTFFYTIGNGSDTIAGANNGDVVYLSQVNLDQIASSNITADAVTLNFMDGGSLQVNSAADITYQLQDGSKFSANHSQSAWLSKSTNT